MFYWSGGLGHPIKNYELVEKGVTDMGWAITGYTPGRFPMASVMELPFLFDNGLSGTRATWEMYEKFINPEFKDVHVLTLSNTGPTDIITAKKPVRKLEDLKGLRIRAIGAGPTSTMKHLGAAPVAISIVDCYEALQKGTIDGMLVATAPLLAMRLYEVVKYVTEVGIYSESFYYVINKKKWMSISPEDRKIISEISGARLSEMGGRSFDQESDFVKGTILPKAGIEMIRLSKEERERWKKSAAPVDDEWLKDMESKGLPGKKLLEAARQLSEKYSEK